MMNTHLVYAALSDTDLLAKLIGPRDAKKHYRGSLASLFVSDCNDAIPPEKCLIAREFVKRCLEEELKRGCVVNSPEAVRDCLRIHFAGQEHESFVVMFLDTQHQLLLIQDLFRGTLSQTSVYPREIVKEALKVNAAAVIFAHNHPSGVAISSAADKVLTAALKSALALVDVRVLDHFIVAGTHVTSFAEEGLL